MAHFGVFQDRSHQEIFERHLRLQGQRLEIYVQRLENVQRSIETSKATHHIIGVRQSPRGSSLNASAAIEQIRDAVQEISKNSGGITRTASILTGVASFYLPWISAATTTQSICTGVILVPSGGWSFGRRFGLHFAVASHLAIASLTATWLYAPGFSPGSISGWFRSLLSRQSTVDASVEHPEEVLPTEDHSMERLYKRIEAYQKRAERQEQASGGSPEAERDGSGQEFNDLFRDILSEL
ncbi:hypothetical protein LTR17_021248 [Elasticomyces elasticus]|nr:hypothetical protein LTR17_021248 [Elasticomyces elasticus]